MTSRAKGFNTEIYGLAKNIFLKKLAKCFATVFDNVLENILKKNTLSVCTLPCLTSTIQLLYRCYRRTHAKISKVLNYQPVLEVKFVMQLYLLASLCLET